MNQADIPAEGFTTAEARSQQDVLRHLVDERDRVGEVHTVASVDVHFPDKFSAHAVAVLLDYPALQPLAVAQVLQPVTFPYVPGLLTYREAPAARAALLALPHLPDLLLVDGQGRAHPRRCGLACHLGLWLDLPAIGAAKSRLVGDSDGPAPEAGATAPLLDQGEVIGAMVRTRSNVKPLYVSVGHRVDLSAAIRWTLACCRGYRLPEPNRWAHRLAGGGQPPAGVSVRLLDLR